MNVARDYHQKITAVHVVIVGIDPDCHGGCHYVYELKIFVIVLSEITAAVVLYSAAEEFVTSFLDIFESSFGEMRADILEILAVME